MKKYLKEIVVFLAIVLCGFLFISTSSESKTLEVNNALPAVNKVDGISPFLIEHFPEKDTKVVRYKLDSLLNRINKRHDFHGAILVAKNQKVVYNNQVGFADFKKKTPLSKESVFQLASVSKQFTAAAIMLLSERNKVRLTDTINSYFPDFPYEGVTIANLLNHTAGLPKYFWVAEHKWHQEWAPRNNEMMALLASSKVQRFYKPGRKFDYSNTGYMVLASIVEKVSGMSFSSFVKTNIFEPLQMTNTYVYSFENDSIKNEQLDGYRLYRGWRHLKINSTVNDAIVGDKNVYSTTEDLFKWTVGLNAGRLLTKESLNLMYSTGQTIYGKKIPYGYGFRIDSIGQKSIYHHGKWNGFSTGLTKYLDDDLVVIVLEHTSFNSMKALNKTIKGIVVENLKV